MIYHYKTMSSATSDFNFDDDDSLTKMPGSIMETEQRQMQVETASYSFEMDFPIPY